MRTLKKQDIIDLGFPKDRLVTLNVPMTIIGDKAVVAKTKNFDSIDDFKNSEFFQNLLSIGILIICENDIVESHPMSKFGLDSDKVNIRYF